MIVFTESDFMDVYIESNYMGLKASVKRLMCLCKYMKSDKIYESNKTDFKKKSKSVDSYVSDVVSAIGSFRGDLQNITHQILNALSQRDNANLLSGLDAIDRKYRNAIEGPIFLALLGITQLDEIYNNLNEPAKIELQDEYNNCINDFNTALDRKSVV